MSALCEVCERPLSCRSRQVTGVCYPCRQAGTTFLREWMRDLRSAPRGYGEIAEVVGTSTAVVRARLSEVSRGLR